MGGSQQLAGIFIGWALPTKILRQTETYPNNVSGGHRPPKLCPNKTGGRVGTAHHIPQDGRDTAPL